MLLLMLLYRGSVRGRAECVTMNTNAKNERERMCVRVEPKEPFRESERPRERESEWMCVCVVNQVEAGVANGKVSRCVCMYVCMYVCM